MFLIKSKEILNSSVIKMCIMAPYVAAKARPGQFIILRVDSEGERIPLTIAGFNRSAGTVDIIFHTVGATTEKLGRKNAGEFIEDFAGPLGTPTQMDGLKKVCIIGGGVGCAIALPVAREFHERGAEVTSIIGFRSRDLLILEEEFKECSDRLFVMTDDGSYGRAGNVCVPLDEMISSGETYDKVLALGPLTMMKYVVSSCRSTGIPCTVSMNPIMIDGTGMCGGCRLTLHRDGETITSFACIDGPEFDGYEVDFDEAMNRSNMYRDFEQRAREKNCRLFEKVF